MYRFRFGSSLLCGGTRTTLAVDSYVGFTAPAANSRTPALAARHSSATYHLRKKLVHRSLRYIGEAFPSAMVSGLSTTVALPLPVILGVHFTQGGVSELAALISRNPVHQGEGQGILFLT
jgi:hypothetical protein